MSIVVTTGVLVGGWFGFTAFQKSRALEALAEETAANLVNVQGGSFTAGNFEIRVELQNGDTENRLIASPQNALAPYEAVVPDFSLLSREALNSSFDLFLSETGRPSQIHDAEYGLGLPDHPAIMTWEEAEGYCQWLGDVSGLALRLPTEVEWEYAARSRGTLVPWGTAGGRWIAGETIHDNDTPGIYTQQANQWPPSPMGFYDLSGGAYEWVSDVADTSRIAKGGSTRSDAFYETIPSRLVVQPFTENWPGESERLAEHGYPYHAAFATARCASDDIGQGPGTVDFTPPVQVIPPANTFN